MITSLNILYSQRAQLEDIQPQVNQHPPGKTLIQVFSGQIEKEQIERLCDELTSLFPGVGIVGTTTAGEILEGKVADHTIVVNFSFFETTTVKTALVDCYDNLPLAGKRLAQTLAPDNPTAIILFGCSMQNGQKVDVSPVLAALYEAMPHAVIAGGQAGDNGNGVISYVFTEKGIAAHGVAAAGLSGDRLCAHNSYTLSWVPIGKKFTITQAQGSRVYSIDGRSPLELYKHYLGPEVVAGLPLSAADFPLMLERDGIPLAAHALGVNDDGSFNFIYAFRPGEQVQFGFCHAGLLSMSAQEIFDDLRPHPAQTVFVYSCVSRKWILGQDIHVELAPIASLGPTVGFFAYGEYFTHPIGKCLLLSQTTTALTLAEQTGEQPAPPFDSAQAPLVAEAASKQLKTLKVLHRLVETSAKEIEAVNQKLAEMAHQDGLTGLSNRRCFDQRLAAELERAKRERSPLSLILIDVDDFKRYNDTYGHVEGDSCLCAVATVLNAVPQRPGDFVSRYGGEEFVCILPNTDFDGAQLLAERIRQEVSQLSIPHLTSTVAGHLTVSLGVQTIQNIPETLTPKALLSLCDQQLYAAKERGRNRVCGHTLCSPTLP